MKDIVEKRWNLLSLSINNVLIDWYFSFLRWELPQTHDRKILNLGAGRFFLFDLLRGELGTFLIRFLVKLSSEWDARKTVSIFILCPASARKLDVLSHFM